MGEKSVDKNLRRVLLLCEEMLEAADRGDAERIDADCGVVYGNLRDAAYKIRRLAENELKRHQRGKAVPGVYLAGNE